MTDKINEEFTVAYWKKKALQAINEAESIADALGESFSWDLAYGMGGYYRPDADSFISKNAALEMLASGQELSDFQKWAIQNAIDKDLSEEDSDGWESSDAGWQSSSNNC